MTVQIDFFDRSATKTLISIKTMQPDRIVLLASGFHKKTVAKNGREIVRLDDALADMEHAINCLGRSEEHHLENPLKSNELEQDNIETAFVDPDSIMEIKTELDRILERYDASDDIIIDLTGGAELMIAAGYAVAQEHDNVIPIYTDVQKGFIVNACDGTPITKTKEIRLYDFMNACGGAMLSGKPDSMLNKQDLDIVIKALPEVSKASGKAYMKFVNVVFGSGHNAGNYFWFKDQGDGRFITDVFCKYNVIKSSGKDCYQMLNEDFFSVFKMKGILLELYIFETARRMKDSDGTPFFDEVRWSVKISWDESDADKIGENEVDVLLRRNNTPMVVSCKMCNLTPTMISEVGYEARIIGGNEGKAVLATTDDVRARKNGEGKSELAEKMKHLGITLIDREDIRKGNVEMKLRKAAE